MRLFATAAICGLAWSTVSFRSGPVVYHPEVLQQIGARVAAERRAGRVPVVIFDLDDTLINTRDRNMRIMRDFARRPDIQMRFAAESGRLAQIQVVNTRYLLTDTLQSLGITNPIFIQKAADFWLATFFTDRYCALDVANPGAAAYVRYLARMGAQIVYLTGRDVPRMSQGTVYSLGRNGFPLDGGNALLLMKPTPAGDDLAYKVSQFTVIARMGTVVAAFENEPKNINAFASGFPGATMVFLNTIHSPAPDVPAPRVAWVKDFTGH